MAADRDAIARTFDEIITFARAYRFEMTEDYRRLIERLESSPGNQTGADKSDVWESLRRYVDSFTVVERSRNR